MQCIRIGLVLVFCIICVACNKQNRDVGSAGATVMIKNYGNDYDYTIFINSEPVKFADGFSFFQWGNYPLKNGINDVLIVASPKNRIESNEEVMTNFQLVVMKEKQIDTIKDISFPISNLNESKFSFQLIIDGMPLGNSSIANDTKRVTPDEGKIVKGIALQILTLLYNSDFEALSKMLNFQSVEDFKKQYPSWIFEKKSKKQITSYVGNMKDLRSVLGKKFIMVVSKQAHTENVIDTSLFKLYEKERNLEFAIQSLVFCKIEKGWGLVGQEGVITPIKVTGVKP
jgi:hypothetical protein